MRIPRIYLNQALITGISIELSIEAHRHVVNVLRLREKDKLILFNGEDREFLCHLEHVEKKSSIIQIESELENNTTSPLKIELGLSLIKNDKLDFAIQKSVELGVTSITPLAAERSTIKLDAKRETKRQAHWQGIIQSACEQSGRSQLPKMNPIATIPNWLAQSNTPGIVFEPTASLPLSKINITGNVRIVIGPEGGFTEQELHVISQHDFNKIKMGPRVLRAETAAITAITALQLLWGDLNID